MFISVFGVAALTDVALRMMNPNQYRRELIRLMSVCVLDDFGFISFGLLVKETHESGMDDQELQSYSTSQVKVRKDGKKTYLSHSKRTATKVVSVV